MTLITCRWNDTTGLDQISDDAFPDASEKAWLQEGLELQRKLREHDPHPKHSAVHKHKSRRVSHAVKPSLYPEVPIVDEARECAENFGQHTLEQLKSVQHRTYSQDQVVAV